MALPFLAQIAIGVAGQVIGYLLAPKSQKREKPSTDDLPEPTTDAGRPIGKVFGSMRIKDTNVLWWGDQSIRERPAVTRKK